MNGSQLYILLVVTCLLLQHTLADTEEHALDSEIKWLGALAWGGVSLLVWSISGMLLMVDWYPWINRQGKRSFDLGIALTATLMLSTMCLAATGVVLTWADAEHARHEDRQDEYSACLAVYIGYLGFFLCFGFSLFKKHSQAWAIIFGIFSGLCLLASAILMIWLNRTASWIMFVSVLLFSVLVFVLVGSHVQLHNIKQKTDAGSREYGMYSSMPSSSSPHYQNHHPYLHQQPSDQGLEKRTAVPVEDERTLNFV